MVHKIRQLIEKTTTGLAVILVLFLVLLSFIQVILRNFFAIGFNAVEELMRNGVLWIAFIGAVLTTLRGKHISIDILLRFLPDAKKRILEWILAVVSSIICLVLMWLGIRFLQLEIEMESLVAGVIPAWTIEIIIPIGFLLLALSFPLRIIDNDQDQESY